jgi:DNA-binding transcriptional ArsR family regulator
MRGPIGREAPSPSPETVLDALEDPDCREIIRALEEPMTASEVVEACDLPSSTAYRKLDLLTDATLLTEGTELRRDGHHATLYEVAFEEVSFALTPEQELTVTVSRPTERADERLARMWQEVRKET